jgi:dienelactone hydrolase
MKKNLKFVLFSLAFLVSAAHINATIGKDPALKSKDVTYSIGNQNFKGYIAWKEDGKAVKPGILVVHEWWGLNDYAKMRADMLADLGYVAMAVDMFGDGKVYETAADAQNAAGYIFSHPDLLKERITKAYDILTSQENVDKQHIAAVGYCFGGTVALNAAAMGLPLEVVASFHGGLTDFKASEMMKNTKVLICNGAADAFVPQADIDNFKSEMDKYGITYEFKNYEGATHAFTNKYSTEAGKKFNMPIAYNEAADKASWQDMISFFEKYFPAK